MMDLVIGVGDMKVSDDPEVVLATYSLGSCIAPLALDGLTQPVSQIDVPFCLLMTHL